MLQTPRMLPHMALEEGITTAAVTTDPAVVGTAMVDIILIIELVNSTNPVMEKLV